MRGERRKEKKDFSYQPYRVAIKIITVLIR